MDVGRVAVDQVSYIAPSRISAYMYPARHDHVRRSLKKDDTLNDDDREKILERRPSTEQKEALDHEGIVDDEGNGDANANNTLLAGAGGSHHGEKDAVASTNNSNSNGSGTNSERKPKTNAKGEPVHQAVSGIKQDGNVVLEAPQDLSDLLSLQEAEQTAGNYYESRNLKPILVPEDEELQNEPETTDLQANTRSGRNLRASCTFKHVGDKRDLSLRSEGILVDRAGLEDGAVGGGQGSENKVQVHEFTQACFGIVRVLDNRRPSGNYSDEVVAKAQRKYSTSVVDQLTILADIDFTDAAGYDEEVTKHIVPNPEKLFEFHKMPAAPQPPAVAYQQQEFDMNGNPNGLGVGGASPAFVGADAVGTSGSGLGGQGQGGVGQQPLSVGLVDMKERALWVDSTWEQHLSQWALRRFHLYHDLCSVKLFGQKSVAIQGWFADYRPSLRIATNWVELDDLCGNPFSTGRILGATAPGGNGNSAAKEGPQRRASTVAQRSFVSKRFLLLGGYYEKLESKLCEEWGWTGLHIVPNRELDDSLVREDDSSRVQRASVAQFLGDASLQGGEPYELIVVGAAEEDFVKDQVSYANVGGPSVGSLGAAKERGGMGTDAGSAGYLKSQNIGPLARQLLYALRLLQPSAPGAAGNNSSNSGFPTASVLMVHIDSLPGTKGMSILWHLLRVFGCHNVRIKKCENYSSGCYIVCQNFPGLEAKVTQDLIEILDHLVFHPELHAADAMPGHLPLPKYLRVKQMCAMLEAYRYDIELVWWKQFSALTSMFQKILDKPEYGIQHVIQKKRSSVSSGGGGGGGGGT